MSRRTRDENSERLRRGLPQEVGGGSSSSHASVGLAPARTAVVNFLNPDVPHGSTSLERAPSLNRLHAQSSTETSGLGETITSGFSSQESVHSYQGDERPSSRTNILERSYKRNIGSPAAIENEFIDKDGNRKIHSRPSAYQEHQEQHLTVPGWNSGHQDRQPRYQDASDRYKARPVRDTGGRSLTPQQAKAEYEERQRRLLELQRGQQRNPSNPHTNPDKRLPGNSSEFSDKQRRTNPSYRQPGPEYLELSGASEKRSGTRQENRGGVNSYYNSREALQSDSNTSTYRRGSSGNKNNPPGKPRTDGKDPPGTPSSNKPSAIRPGNKDPLEGNRTTSGNRTSNNRSATTLDEKQQPSEPSPWDRERRSSKKSTDQNKTQGNSSRNNSDEFYESGSSFKSFETVRHKSRSQDSIPNSDDEIFLDSCAPHSLKSSTSKTPDVSTRKNSRDNTRNSRGDLRENSPKFTNNQSERGSNPKISSRQREGNQGKDNKIQSSRNAWSGSGDLNYLQAESRNPFVSQRSDPVETQRRLKETKRQEKSKSSEIYKSDEDSSRKSHCLRTSRQGDENYRDDSKNVSGSVSIAPNRIRNVEARERGNVRSSDSNPREVRSSETRPDDDRRRREARSREASTWGHGNDGDARLRNFNERSDRFSSSLNNFNSKQPQKGERGQSDEKPYHRSLRDVQEDDTAPERLWTAKGNMNYERLSHDASRSMDGTGGGGESWRSREYPAALDGGYSSTSTRSIRGGGIYANVPRNGHGRGQNPHPSVSVTTNPSEQRNPVQQTRSLPYTKFQVSSTHQGPVPIVQLTSPDSIGLELDNEERDWERRDSRSSNRSQISKNSVTGSNLFLGLNTGSAWTKWSRERRASYRRRLEKLEQEEPKEIRISTPIKKARQEGLKFVHPDLEGRYLSEDDLKELRRHKQQQVQAMRVIERSRRSKFRLKNEVKLTPEQWHMLEEFWNHSLFLWARYFGIFISLIALVFMTISITNRTWISYSSWNLTVVEGLWTNCSKPTAVPNSVQDCHSNNGRNWQNAVIGLMIFAAAFGLLASVLSICGIFTNPLPRKIYYFHSAGEIFFICALSASVALIIFPIAVELDGSIHSQRYGIGYGLGWAGTLFFVAAAVCLSLDDLVRESSRARCCRLCWRGRQNERNELRQV